MSGSPSSARRRRKSGACLPGSPGPACSIACRACWSELFSCGRAAPGCGGRRLKSGGIVSGARDSTANSSGVDRSSPIAFFRSLQPEINNAQAKQRKGVRARGARNRYSQDMAQMPPHPVFLMRFASTKQATRNSGSGGGLAASGKRYSRSPQPRIRSCKRTSSAPDRLPGLRASPGPTLSPRRCSLLCSALSLSGRSGFRTSTSPITPPTIRATPSASRAIKRGMAVLRRLVFAALCAGLLSGVFGTVAHQIVTVPLILQAETFEKSSERALAAAHEHTGAWEPENGAERTAYTLLADILTGVGFALLVGAGLTLRGGEVGWRQGLLWGLAGFATFVIAPSLGLPPQLPGSEAAPLLDRQVWWLGAAVATGRALALIAFTIQSGGPI